MSVWFWDGHVDEHVDSSSRTSEFMVLVYCMPLKTGQKQQAVKEIKVFEIALRRLASSLSMRRPGQLIPSIGFEVTYIASISMDGVSSNPSA